MGTDIDTIFKMLSWNSSEKEQLRGIDEAKKIEYLSVLFQPIEDKSVWENCAKVISSKSDNELKKYMNNMFEWISSLALVIFEVICCVMFFESFCKEQENWKKWHKYVLIGIQTAEFFACGMFYHSGSL